MFYKVKQCNDLIIEKYDVVVRYRADLMLMDELQFDRLDPRYLHIPGMTSRLCKESSVFKQSFPWYIQDVCAIGNQKQMNDYSSCFDRLPEIINETDRYNPHVILNHHLKNTSIRCVPISMYLKRVIDEYNVMLGNDFSQIDETNLSYPI